MSSGFLGFRIIKNKGEYTTEIVAYDWAGVVMRKLSGNAEINRPADRPTNQWTNVVAELRARD